MPLVYIVEDDANIREIESFALKNSGFAVEAFACAKDFYNGLLKRPPDLVLLDIMLPDLDGFQVLQKIRQTSNVPVLMLTAKSDEEDKVFGLRMGADDYLTKPFSLNELMARVHSLIRRYTQFNPVSCPDTDTLTFQGMTIDNVNRIVEINGIRAELTGKEFDLLSFLASNKGSIFTKKQIYNQVWEEEYAFDDSNIMSFISKLRKKIEPDPEHPFYILTVRGIGYRFNGEA